MIYLIPFLSVVLGYIVAIFLQPKNKKNLKLLLAFSGSFLLALTVSHLLPQIFTGVNKEIGEHLHNNIGMFIMAGILFQIILEYFSQGAEHGHVHGHNDLAHIPWALFVSLCLHALLEGMPISQHPHVAWGISIHHFPIAIILTIFLIQSHLNKIQIAIFMLSFALMTPMGTYISVSMNFLVPFHKEITAFVIGILFHISSTIIFESSEGHKFNLAKLIAIILGIVLAYFM
ncbi:MULTISPECIES: ZIP family metal transporter [Flavobacterium]|uniref:ZIP family metal transporter n=2 Tax=Flavobacterium TaxID=237 RepID=A0AA94F2I3_9FLAO|nr:MULTISPECIES: ZIP family metal transporter [Flavobacterium]AMA48608.1 ZIP family metal transporter [Flavobacterium covae]MCH4830554.1 ZIP family metal transporter [Flavobacterium columnare]MCH4833508.1 ZIP family metal transporter [Flavobacterium columnare]MCJ1807084.1 ZIP family metal transporter [Flavobacterium covae]MCJ1808335.1 ZIP family metal transporter [Flavobacterium covae]